MKPWKYAWGDTVEGPTHIETVLNQLAAEGYRVVSLHRKEHVYEVIAVLQTSDCANKGLCLD